MIIAWMRAFSAEALAGHDPSATDDAAMVDRRFRHGGDLMWFWERDGQPVSFAWRSPLSDPQRWPRVSAVRVSAVYTPPEHRGYGYAGANVAALSQRSLDDGASACMLYTDAANPTSNKVYERIGYRQVGAAQDWLFS
jgi:predicted GNAT family acetyltransferase